MKALYKFHYDCGRQGSLTGIFVADEDKVKKLIDSGQEIYFGEVLGKHSEVCGPIEEGDLTFVTNDEKVISIVEEFNLETGYNPFDYIDEETYNAEAEAAEDEEDD